MIPYEEVVKELAADTLSRGSSVGLVLRGGRKFTCGSFCSNAAVVMKVRGLTFIIFLGGCVDLFCG